MAQLVDVRLRDRRAEDGPAAAGLELRRRREQRLAGDDVDVDPRLGGVQVFTGPRALGRAFLGDAVLLGGEPGDGFGALAVGAHGGSPNGVLPTWGRRGGFESRRGGGICKVLQERLQPRALPWPLTLRDRKSTRRVGEECVSTCRSRGSPVHKKKTNR